jgi:hypothetical protein
MHQVASRVNQLRHFFLTEHERQSPRHFRVRKLLLQIWPLQHLREEELHSGHALLDSSLRKLPVTKQMELKLADVLGAKLIRRTMEILGELPQS